MATKLEGIRYQYPNAYKPWLSADDKRLIEEYGRGKSNDELAKVFGRQPSAIMWRLVHLEEIPSPTV